MGQEALGWSLAALVILLISVGGASRWARRASRDPSGLVRTLSAPPSTVVQSRFGLIPGGFVAACLAIWLGWVGLANTSGTGLVLLLGVASYLAVAAVLLTSGRIGDRTIVLTQEGIRQRDSGLEQSVRWEDITHVAPTGEGLDLYASSVALRRTAPRLWTGRDRRLDGAMRLQLGDVPRSIGILDALMTWIDEPWRRAEIGTEQAVGRLIRRPEGLADN